LRRLSIAPGNLNGLRRLAAPNLLRATRADRDRLRFRFFLLLQRDVEHAVDQGLLSDQFAKNIFALRFTAAVLKPPVAYNTRSSYE